MIINIMVSGLLVYESILDGRSNRVDIVPMIIVAVCGMVINILEDNLTIIEQINGITFGLVIILICFISKQRIGYGDGILAITLGMCLGGSKCAWIIWTSLVLVSICGGIIAIREKKNIKFALPYTPFVAICYGVTNLIGI